MQLQNRKNHRKKSLNPEGTDFKINLYCQLFFLQVIVKLKTYIYFNSLVLKPFMRRIELLAAFKWVFMVHGTQRTQLFFAFLRSEDRAATMGCCWNWVF